MIQERSQPVRVLIDCVSTYNFNIQWIGVISGFHREVDENRALLGYYAASSGNFLPAFRDNLSVPYSGFNNSGILEPWRLAELVVPKRR